MKEPVRVLMIGAGSTIQKKLRAATKRMCLAACETILANALLAGE